MGVDSVTDIVGVIEVSRRHRGFILAGERYAELDDNGKLVFSLYFDIVVTFIVIDIGPGTKLGVSMIVIFWGKVNKTFPFSIK